MKLSKFVAVTTLISSVLLSGCNSDSQQGSATVSAAEGDRPNILFIITDDLGYADVGFNGSPDITTPALDELAHGGTIFTSAYNTHPFCGPSRAGLMTGRYPHKFGSQYNLPSSDASGEIGIPTSEIFFSKVLQQSGYFTGAVGKWHLGETEEYHPHARGFDEFYGFLFGGHEYFPERYKAKYKQWREQGLERAIFDYFRPLEYNGKEVTDDTEYLTDGLSTQAVKFIEKASTKKDQPFFLYLAYNAPHTPMQAKEEDMAMFPHITDKKRKVYAGMVYAVDRGVKRIVESLKATGQYDNTLIVFLSDNGGKVKTGANNYPLTAGKGSVHEGGFRTPMFMHWPKGLEAGKTYKHPVSTLDFFPTFSGLANAEVPNSVKLDGVDILPAVRTDESARPGEYIFAMRHRLNTSDVSARKDEWKVIKTNHGKWQLYNVELDPGETTDLSAEYPHKIREMANAMNTWSWSHAEPLWFHIQKAKFRWKEENMPRFHETFAINGKGVDE